MSNLELTEKTFIKSIDGFKIYFTPELEYSSLDELLPDDTEEQIADLYKKLGCYDFVLFCAKVSAEKAGIELGTDYLGGCIYDSYEQFYTEYKNDYFADMVENAINEAKQTIKSLCE